MSYLQKLGLLCMNTEAAIVFGNLTICFPKSLLSVEVVVFWSATEEDSSVQSNL